MLFLMPLSVVSKMVFAAVLVATRVPSMASPAALEVTRVANMVSPAVLELTRMPHMIFLAARGCYGAPGNPVIE
jgi:hypothetical protein